MLDTRKLAIALAVLAALGAVLIELERKLVPMLRMFNKDILPPDDTLRSESPSVPQKQ